MFRRRLACITAMEQKRNMGCREYRSRSREGKREKEEKDEKEEKEEKKENKEENKIKGSEDLKTEVCFLHLFSMIG